MALLAALLLRTAIVVLTPIVTGLFVHPMPTPHALDPACASSPAPFTMLEAVLWPRLQARMAMVVPLTAVGWSLAPTATPATDAATVVLPVALALQSACWAAISVVFVTLVPLPDDASPTATAATAAAEDPLTGEEAVVVLCADAEAPFQTSSDVRLTVTADHRAMPPSATPTAAALADPSPIARAVAVDAVMHVAALS